MASWQVAFASWTANIYYFIISKNADSIDYLYEGGGGGGGERGKC